MDERLDEETTRRRRWLRIRVGLFGGILAALALSLSTDTLQTQPIRYASPCALAATPDGRTLYVAEHTAGQVVLVDRAHHRVQATIALGDGASGLALSPAGSMLFVTAGGPDGRVYLIDTASHKTVGMIPVGHTPLAPVVTPDGLTVLVCNRFSNSVSVIDPGTGTETSRIPVVREPVAAAVTPDGRTLLVANHLPTAPSTGDAVAAQVSVIDVVQRRRVTDIDLPNGSTGLRGICVSPDGRYAYVTHVLARYQEPTTQLDRGWMNTNALSVIDVAGLRWWNTVLLDDVDRGAANPWAVACAGDGLVCVTHSGTRELSVIDRVGLHAKLSASPSPETVPDDLAFLRDLRVRVRLTGHGPRGLAATGPQVVVAEYLSDSIAVVDLAGRVQVGSIGLGTPDVLTPGRRGERLFNDGSWCFQQWQSCGSCHPDVAADGLNWDLLNDGISTYRNTKSLLLSYQTPPMMMTGSRADAETAIRAGMRYVQFAISPEPEAMALDEYLRSVAPVPSPCRVHGQLSQAAQRGRALFGTAGCGRCHKGPLFTDLHAYDVQTGRGRDAGRAFDTPTLVNVWRTAPYLYNGQARTIREVLTTFNPEDQHGATSSMTGQDVNDLAEYVLSL